MSKHKHTIDWSHAICINMLFGTTALRVIAMFELVVLNYLIVSDVAGNLRHLKVKLIDMSYFVLSSSINSANFLVCKSSDGFGGTGPHVKTSRPGCSDF